MSKAKAKPETKSKPVAVGYARTNTIDTVADAAKLQGQRQAIRAWCEKHGYHLLCIYVEPGVSGLMELGERPAGRLLLGRLRDGGVDVVVATDIARIGRAWLETVRLLHSWLAKGVRVVFTEEPHCDHNEMIPNIEPGYAWKCAKCGHVYGKENA